MAVAAADLKVFADEGRLSVNTEKVEGAVQINDSVSVTINTPGIALFEFKKGGNFKSPLEVHLHPFKDNVEALTWDGEDIREADGIQVSSGFAGGEISIYFMTEDWVNKINEGGNLQVIDELR